MGKTVKTASEILAQIEKECFKGVNLKKACGLKDEERRTFRLAQVNRLLVKPEYAMWLSDSFWTADEGRNVMYEDEPLTSPQGLKTLTKEEKERLKLIMEIAGLCHDLSLHFTFNLKEAFGIRNNFWVTNKQLVEWLLTTEYEHVAMHTAYIMKKFAINVYADTFYQPAQDAMAELYSSEYHESVGYPQRTEIPSRAYVKIILDELMRIERHWKRGRRLKLNPEAVMLHDEIYGFVPPKFDKGIIAAAQELYDYMDKEVKGRLMLEEYNPDDPWSEQPESVKRATSEVLGHFADKVREVRDRDFGKGWIADYSLEFNYLLAHAERCGRGWWNGEEGIL